MILTRYLLAGLLAILIAAPAMAETTNDRDACLGRDPDAAIDACTRVLEGKAKLTPADRARYLVGRGIAHGAKDQRQLAIDDYSRAIEIDPTVAEAYRRRGFLRHWNNDNNGALADFNQAITRDPKDAGAYNGRGLVLDRKGDGAHAVEDYGKAIELNPKFAAAYYNRALSLRRRGDVSGAIADFDRAIELNPKDADWRTSRSTAWLFKGDNINALHDADEVVRLAPDKAGSYLARARTLTRMREFTRALADVDQAIQREPHNIHVLNLRSVIKREKGDYDGAIADIDEVLSIDPKFAEARANRGEAYRLKDDPDRALADFNEALRVFPDLGPTLTFRGLLFESRGDMARARDDFTAALAAPERPYLVTGWADIARAHLTSVEAGIRSTQAGGTPTPPPTAVVTAPTPPKSEAIAVTPGKRVALVIGNGAYRYAPRLTNPPNDAGDIARSLRKLDFDVIEGIDVDKIALEQKIREFGRKLDGAGIALFFYAGHGLQVADKNYLVPVDAKLERAGDLALDTITVDDVLAQMESERRTNLVFLDACRDNPLTRSLAAALGTRSASVGSGLAEIQSAVGTMIVYATQPKNVALDGEGRNSPFTSALLKHIATPGLEIGTMMKRVRADVYETTHQRQLPWDHSSLIGEVVLAR